MLARSPGFTAIATLSLALGIGLNSALFSFHDAILLRPLPVRDPGAIVTVGTRRLDEPPFAGSISYPNYRDLRDQSQSFDGLVAYQLSRLSFARSREAVRDIRLAMAVSDNFFDVLDVRPALGRRFRADEGQVPGRDAVVVLGYDFWKNVLAEDRSILNNVVLINGIDFTVVGVAPAGFTGMDQYVRPAFFVPIVMSQRLGGGPENPLEDRAVRAFTVKGRLKSGVSLQDAQNELTRLWRGLEREYPDANRDRRIAVRTELQERVQTNRGTSVLTAMMTALAALVLLIACANVANLMLGRAHARSREMAVRLALGVSRMQLVRPLLTESILLALVGAALGLGFAYGGIRFLSYKAQTLVPTDIPVVVEPVLDARVLVVALFAAVLSALLFGLAPARQSLKTQLAPSLKGSDQAPTTRQRTPGRNMLVVAQIALSMVLLVGAGMLLAGFRRVLDLDPGFRTDQLTAMSLDTSYTRYTPVQTRNLYRGLVDRARSLPGVVSVTLTSAVPLDQSDAPGLEAVVPEGYRFPEGRQSVPVRAAAVDEHYFATMGTEIVRGRAFTADDKDGSRRVTIVNQEFAKTYWPDQD